MYLSGVFVPSAFLSVAAASKPDRAKSGLVLSSEGEAAADGERNGNVDTSVGEEGALSAAAARRAHPHDWRTLFLRCLSSLLHLQLLSLL